MTPEFEDEKGTTVQDRRETKTPRKFVVILHNDDFTPMDFVVAVLVQFFEKDLLSAIPLMMEVHQKGSSKVGLYTREIAETKVAQATDFARKNNHPLNITMQPE